MRDTLTVELLLDGMPVERVSVLLGHSSVKITERHYSSATGTDGIRLDARVAHDPITQAEQLRCDTTQKSAPSLQMAATSQRHEKGEAVNQVKTQEIKW